MDVIAGLLQTEKIRGFLVFFCVLLLTSCQEDPQTETLGVRYKDGRAVAVSFMADPEGGPYKIYIAGQTTTSVLGIISRDKFIHTFIPALPFTAGTSYVIRAGTDSIAGFSIGPMNNRFGAPELTAIHPRRDTIPENLLKCYLLFSEPMQAVGRALDFVKVRELESGKEVPVFLDLDSELWNSDHSRLTLWLDPGRIKTDLIPNRSRGTPINEGQTYRIEISGLWRSAKGIPLGKDYHKSYFVEKAIRTRINPSNWDLKLPASGTHQLLEVFFDSPPDLFMALSAIRVRNSEGQALQGEWRESTSNKSLIFTPANKWKTGKYELLIDKSLEDLAGNTVNRLFDTNLKAGKVVDSVPDDILIPFILND